MQLSVFLAEVAAWAESRADVLGLAIVGSHARGSAHPDSDVDLLVLCVNANVLASNNDWVRAFGDTSAIAVEQYGIVQAVRVFYVEGLEIEFGLSPLVWADVPLDPGTMRVASDGMRILYDPEHRLEAVRIAAAS